MRSNGKVNTKYIVMMRQSRIYVLLQMNLFGTPVQPVANGHLLKYTKGGVLFIMLSFIKTIKIWKCTYVLEYREVYDRWSPFLGHCNTLS